MITGKWPRDRIVVHRDSVVLVIVVVRLPGLTLTLSCVGFFLGDLVVCGVDLEVFA